MFDSEEIVKRFSMRTYLKDTEEGQESALSVNLTAY